MMSDQTPNVEKQKQAQFNPYATTNVDFPNVSQKDNNELFGDDERNPEVHNHKAFDLKGIVN
jgi:hypothetical protein